MKSDFSMYKLAERLFPICRSITGAGVRETLGILKEYVPEMEICEVPSGTTVFDWTVPKEWVIKAAYIENSKGERIIDFKDNNLYVIGYSTSVDKIVGLEELKEYIWVDDTDETAIPYVTSYYKERFGFCMSRVQRDSLVEDQYHMYIDSELREDGYLTYGEVIFPGNKEQEILLSTYVCHPSMANNELSGPVVAAKVCKYIRSLSERKYTYRIVFIPETIGAITYLSKNLDKMKKNVIAGFVLTCIGDNRTYSYVASKYGNTLADRVVQNVLQYHYPSYEKYSYLERGSDERQYNAPGIELPVCTICRSKFGAYPEYHTSKDDMTLISEEGLEGGYEVIKQCIDVLEYNAKYVITCMGEPQLGKRGLFPTISKKGVYDEVRAILNFIAYADGNNDLIDISNIIGISVKDCLPIVYKLKEGGLLISIDNNIGE